MLKRHLAGKRVFVLLAALPLLACWGCGQLTDKDRIRVAKIGDRYITRGDLFKIIREMPDNERPLIRNRSDLVRILNQHIDSRIKIPLGKRLAAEGKIQVDREVAREMFFQDGGDEEEQLRNMWSMEIPPPGVVTPLMQVYGLTPELLQFNKDTIEEGTDRMVEKLQGEQAVDFLARQAEKEGRLTLEESEIQREYGFMKDQMVSPETIDFSGIRFVDAPDAAARASQLRERLNGGETFDALLAEYAEKGKAENTPYVIEASIANDPAKAHLRPFWNLASGAEPGTIIGPVYLPAYQQKTMDAAGKTSVSQMPPSYLLCKVLTHTPETPLPYEQARPMVAIPLLVSKMMHQLREENGVEIYEDQLPDPSHVQGPAAI